MENAPIVTQHLVDELKSRTSDVRGMMKSRFKIDAGQQGTHDVIAVANGFKDHNTLVGLAKKSNLHYYTIQANLGDDNTPFIVEKEVGVFAYIDPAINEAGDMLRECTQTLTWTIYEDGNPTDRDLKTYPSPKNKLTAHISINADRMIDLDNALDKIKEYIVEMDVKKGMYNSPSSYDFDFTVYGEEFNHFNDSFNLDRGEEYILFDDGGIIGRYEEEDDAYSQFLQIKSGADDVNTTGVFILAEHLTLDEASEVEMSNEGDITYFAVMNVEDEFELDNSVLVGSDLMEILDSVKEHNEHTYSLYFLLESHCKIKECT